MKDYSDELLISSPQIPQKLSATPWLDVNTPFSMMLLGQARSGKGVAMDWIVQKMYDAGIFIIHLYSALGYENLYYTINKNCESRWSDELKAHPERETELGCRCFGTIPILWVIPDYIEMNQQSLDQFNEKYLTKEECRKQGILEWNPKMLSDKKAKLVIRKFTTPTTPTRTEEFREQFYDIVKQAKAEHRILVNSPAVYPTTPHGKIEKYHVVSEIFRYIQDELAHTDLFAKHHSNKPRNQWTNWERSNHKICIICNEARAIAPSPKLSGDKESGVSKRAMYNFLPEKRHAKSWVFWDLQSPADMFDGVRNQADIIIIKRTTERLISEHLLWFYQKIDRIIDGIYESWGFDPRKPVPTAVRMRLLKTKHLSRIAEIPDNFGYVLIENGEFKLRKFNTPKWHHKSDRDSFEDDTGINWKIKIDKNVKLEEEPKSAQKKEIINGIMLRIEQMTKEKLKFPEIIPKLALMENDGTIPDIGISKLSPKALNNKYNRWREKRK